MKFNISKVTSKVNSAVGVAAGLTIGIAITLTAAVHIKHCIKDLLPAKKRKVEIHVFECPSKDEVEQPEVKPENGEAPSETVELDSIKYAK